MALSLADLLKSFIKPDGMPSGDNNALDPNAATGGSADSGVMSTDTMKAQKNQDNSRVITTDSGTPVDFDYKKWKNSEDNPFRDLIDKLPMGGQGTITGFLKNMLGSDQSKLVPNTGTVGGMDPTVVPGQNQDAALNPTPMPMQKQRRLALTTPPSDSGMPDLPTANTTVRPKDYSQPTALDPVQIEQLRQSLMTQTGMMDPNNPNGLSGRMNDPNSKLDMQRQGSEATDISNSLRFPGEITRPQDKKRK